MSYALHIWQASSPLPTSVEGADRQLTQLRDSASGQDPGFLVLAQRLTQRYPCICSKEAEAIPESEWAWSDGPLTGKTDAAIWTIGLASGMVGEVAPFVVKQANALGFAVMDEQAGRVYLAGGTVLSMVSPAKGAPARNYDDVPTQTVLRGIAADRLAPVLQAYGYKFRKSSFDFRLAFATGWHEIHVHMTDRWPLRCDLRLAVSSRFNAVTDLLATLVWQDRSPKDIQAKNTTVLSQHQWIEKGDPLLKGEYYAYAVASFSEVDAVMAHMISNLETGLMPILEKYKTIEGFDELMNPDPVSSSLFFFEKLPSFGAQNVLAAYLAGNPRLGAICEEFASAVDKAPKGDDHSINFAKRSTELAIQYVRAHRQAQG